MTWRGQQGDEHDRLASPLILKAAALADGGFVPCALWLERAYPVGGRVVAGPLQCREFDKVQADQDGARFRPLVEAAGQPPGRRLRYAFYWWLGHRHLTTEVAP
jgi:CRISPR-associated protein Cmr1